MVGISEVPGVLNISLLSVPNKVRDPGSIMLSVIVFIRVVDGDEIVVAGSIFMVEEHVRRAVGKVELVMLHVN